VRRDHGVELEIVDIQAIAEFLADPDLFWVAQEFLRIPAQLAPVSPTESDGRPQWYLELRRTWRKRISNGDLAASYGDLADLRSGLDRAIFNSDARGDIDHWATAIATLIHSSGPRLRQLARYSVAVSRYRGGSTVAGDGAARLFFEELPTAFDPGLLHDASVLIAYLATAIENGLSAISRDVCEEYRTSALRICDDLLAQNPGPNTRASLLDTAASLCLKLDMVALRNRRNRSDERPPMSPPSEYLGRKQLDVGALPLISPDQGMAYLARLVEVLPEAPLFPAETSADLFDLFTESLIDLEGFDQIRQALDQAVDRAAGSAAVADRCQTRGRKLADAGRPLDALREFHEAKDRWWRSGSVAEVVVVLLELSQVYYALNLGWAAKNYCLASAMLAGRDADHRILHLAPRGVFYAAICDASVGAWRRSGEALSVALTLQVGAVANPWQDVHNFMKFALQLHAYWYAELARSESTASHWFRQRYSDLGIESLLVEMADDLDPGGEGAGAELAALARRFCVMSPSDIGSQCAFSWSALGVSWTVRCPNTGDDVRLAERFCAIAQVALAELASVDLLLLGAEVVIETSRGSGDELGDVRALSEKHGLPTWEIKLREYEYADLVQSSNSPDLIREALGGLLFILSQVSVHDIDTFEERVRGYVPGIQEKAIAIRPYDELVSFDEVSQWRAGDSIDSFEPLAPTLKWTSEGASNEMLPAMAGDAEEYDHDRSLELVGSRYLNAGRMVEISLPKVLLDEGTRQAMKRLRQNDGWLDWHLLTALANVVSNYRMTSVDFESLSEEELRDLAYRPERDNYLDIPIAEFSEEALRQKLAFSATGTLQIWGKRVNLSPLDPNLLLSLLGSRFRYWSDDVSHEALDLD
jgi:hypothetical protein